MGNIYYSILHTRFNGGSFSGIELSTEKGREDMLNTIELIVGWVNQAEEKLVYAKYITLNKEMS